MPKTATFLGIFRNFAVIFPNSNVETFLPPMPPITFRALAKYADTKSYGAREARKIAIGRTRVVGLDHRALLHVRPMLTMTGISYLKASGT